MELADPKVKKTDQTVSYKLWVGTAKTPRTIVAKSSDQTNKIEEFDLPLLIQLLKFITQWTHLQFVNFTLQYKLTLDTQLELTKTEKDGV